MDDNLLAIDLEKRTTPGRGKKKSAQRLLDSAFAFPLSVGQSRRVCR